MSDKSVSAAGRMIQRLFFGIVGAHPGLERAAIKRGRGPAGEAYIDSGLNFRNGLTTGTVTPDQVTNIVAGIGIAPGFCLFFDPDLHRVQQRNIHGTHGHLPLQKMYGKDCQKARTAHTHPAKRSFNCDTLNCKRPDFMPLIGYARVSTEDQTPLPQSEALQSAGCAEIFEEHASGGNRARPVLARLLERVQSGDTLVVVRIDRLARSLSHLLEVIERLEAKGAFFRSIQDPIDTGSPQGKFTLQVLGAAAEFERALIRERTKAGLASARDEGRVGGNPGLRAQDPAALRKVRLARQDGYMDRLGETAQDWVPQVRRLRPHMAWRTCCASSTAPCPMTGAGPKAAS